MKKTNFWIIAAVLCIVSACSDNTHTYQLSGKLENCNECTVYLMEMQDAGVKALDTVVADKKGNFKAKEVLNEESIFILQAKNDYIMLCPKAKEKIKINGNYTDLASTYSVQGSDESSKLKLLNDKQIMTRVALKNMSEQLAMMNIDDGPQIRKSIAEKYKLLRQTQREFLINYINTNEGSLTTLVALYRNMENSPLIDPIKDFDIYVKVLKGLEKKYPDNKNTENLKRLVADIQSAKQNNPAN
ncbi:MAG: DUF4369 domain-containing protein [Bacteroidales bacterium]|nr:DUF4369 domain-containing protein [Bacteroidales bacterium]